MKRIIKCPKCEAKLAIFDLGKPINQKCPKCNHSFVIESESQDKAKAEPAKDVLPEPSAVTVGVSEPRQEAQKATSEPAKEPVAKADTPPAPSTIEEKKSAAPAAEEKKAPETVAPAVAKVSEEKKKEVTPKEITVKKPEERKTAPVKPRMPSKAAMEPSDFSESSDLPPAGGSSLFSTAITVGLLLFVIAIQIMIKVRADKQYAVLAAKLERIEAKVQTLK